MSKLLFKNATIYTGYEGKVLFNTDILVNEDKIVKISKSIVDNEAKVIDCSNKFITPGLINNHAHMFGTGKPSRSLGKGFRQTLLLKYLKTPFGLLTIRRRAKNAARMALMGGVTTMRTSGDLRYSDVWLRDKHFSDTPNLIVPGYAITCTTGHGHGTFAITSDDPETLRKMVRMNASHGVDYIKTCTTGGIMDATKKGEPGVVKITKEQLTAIVDEAHKLGLSVASHTESTAGVILDVECGVDFIEHGSPYPEELKETMKKNNVRFTATLTPSVAFCELPFEVSKCNKLTQYNSRYLTNDIIRCSKQALKDNIGLGLGTDSACTFAFQHLAYREMLYAEKMIGVSKAKALEMMTINNAKLLGVDKKVGSIEVGKNADLLIMSNDPMKNIDNFYDLDLIVHNGKTFKQKKYFKFKKFERIMLTFKCLPEYELLD